MSLNHLVTGGKSPVQDVSLGDTTIGLFFVNTADQTIRYNKDAATPSERWIVQPTPTQFFINNGDADGVVLTSGNTAWGATSDANRKKNIHECKDCLGKLSQVKSYKFDYKKDPTDDSSRLGLLAQEVEVVYPEAVMHFEDKEGPTMAIKYSELVGPLIGAVNELRARVEALEAAP